MIANFVMMTHWSKKVYNFVVWSMLLYEALDLRITYRLLLNSFYLAIIITFILLKITQLSFQELVSYLVISVYSYFSNMTLFLQNVDDIGVIPYEDQKCFLEDDINSLQMFGTVLLISPHGGYNSFFVWLGAVLSLSFVMLKLRAYFELPEYSTERDESMLPLITVLSCWLFLTSVYTFSFSYSVASLLVVLISSCSLSEIIVLPLKRYITFLNLSFRAQCLRVALFSFTVLYIALNNSFLNVIMNITSVMVASRFYYGSGIRLCSMVRRKRRLSVNIQTVSSDKLLNHSDPCPVCLCKMTSANITKCKHLFHSDCLDLCLRRQPTCPVCRQLLII